MRESYVPKEQQLPAVYLNSQSLQLATPIAGGPLILVIEKDVELRRYIHLVLMRNKFAHVVASAAKDGLTRASTKFPDLIILDIDDPIRLSVDLIRELRQRTKTPILLLTVQDDDQALVPALDAGANDYLLKPFTESEFLMRIRVSLQRAMPRFAGSQPSIYVIDSLSVDLFHRQVFVEDRAIHLTPIEYKLLSILVQHAGQVVTQVQLLKEVWGPACVRKINYLHLHIAHLRHKLGDDAEYPHYILTEPGVGYRARLEM